MKSCIYGLLAGLLLLSSGSIHAETDLSAEQARELVAEFVRKVTSYQADFAQVLIDEGGDIQDEESGTLWLQRPGQFYWHYLTPWERQIVSDGETVWLYDSELEQVTVRSAGAALQSSPAALLVGDLSALEGYRYSGVESAGGSTTVTLRPAGGDGDFDAVELGFSNGLLQRLVLLDKFRQRTVVTLSDIAINPELDEAIFSFDIPEGADVIDQSGG